MRAKLCEPGRTVTSVKLKGTRALGSTFAPGRKGIFEFGRKGVVIVPLRPYPKSKPNLVLNAGFACLGFSS